MSRSRWCSYHLSGKSCWVLVYSTLLCWCFSGSPFEEMVASLTWPCQLPPGWTVDWDVNLAKWHHDGFTWCYTSTSVIVLFSTAKLVLWTLYLCHKFILKWSTSCGTWLIKMWISVVISGVHLRVSVCILVSIEVIIRGCIGLDPTDCHLTPF